MTGIFLTRIKFDMDTLKKYRREQKITQKGLADSLGIEQATVSRLERGDILPSLALACKIEEFTSGAILATSWVPSVEAASK